MMAGFHSIPPHKMAEARWKVGFLLYKMIKA